MELINATLIFSAILLIAALSGLISEKAGIVNVAIEGLMIIGALVFKIFGGLFQGDLHFWTIIGAIVLAAIITSLFALIHGYTTIVLHADHVISGTAINLLAAGVGLFLSFELAPEIAVNNEIAAFQKVYDNPFVNPQKQQFQVLNVAYFVIALIISCLSFVYFKFTKFGFRHASIGENPNAADSAGVKVIRHKWVAIMMSGALAGIAGAFTMVKITVFTGSVQGLGFVALAIMILGQWRIELMTFVAIIFALLYSVADRYVFIHFPKDLMKTLPFILSLVSLVGLAKFQSMPQADGKHFDQAKR